MTTRIRPPTDPEVYVRVSLILSLVLAMTACGPEDDFDLDGIPASEDCDDFDNALRGPSIWFEDADGDGWAAPGAASQVACVRPTGFARSIGDCDDSEPNVNPTAPETCNGEDDDCDSFIDESTGIGTWYTDADGDGFGDPEAPVEACEGTGGLVLNNRDCDDGSDAIQPGADEVCDGVDNNCNGRTDENEAIDANRWFNDRDGDGYGVVSSSVLSCDAPAGSWSMEGGDCDDGDDSINPGAAELCDTVDNDCDGRIDGGESADAVAFYPDNDRDGYGDEDAGVRSCFQPPGFIPTGGDCDDRDRFISPDTQWFLDADEDDYGDPDIVVTSCEDPSTTSDIYLREAGDCNDADDAIHPLATEVCDEVDNNCDGSTDGADATDATTFYMDYDDDGYGDLARPGRACELPSGFTTDSTDCNDDNRYAYPGAVEFCDGIDNDCDKLVDRNDPDVTSPTWYLDADGDAFGTGSVTRVSCEPPEDYVLEDGDCNDSDEDVNPDATEVCDAGVDNDCDGLVDKSDPSMTGDGTWYRDTDGDGLGDPDLNITTCTATAGYVRNDNDCDDTDADLGPPADCWDAPLVFSTCGQSDDSGPSQKDCDSSYSGTDLDGEVTVSGGKQQWVVPFDGTFRIEAWGAAGGNSTNTSYPTSRSKGARMRGDFELEKGDVLWLAVGQQGTAAQYGGGGGGGSWVVEDSGDPLLVAGGGGGIYYFVGYYTRGAAGCPGLTSTYGGNGTTSTSGGSCTTKTTGEGSGGSAYSSVGGGGGGYKGSGAADSRSSTGGLGWNQGLAGGSNSTGSATQNALGGYGGGGGAYFGGGGGGGYSGGNSGYRGGGGGSYNDGTNASNTQGTRSGNGQISIDYIED